MQRVEMEMQLSEQDAKDIQEVKMLHFNFEIETGRQKCEAILKDRPQLYQIRSYYGFFLQYFNQKQSLNEVTKVYQQAPFYFENTSYLLDIIHCCFERKGRDLIKIISKQYSEYQGEKDGFYFICVALLYRIDGEHDKSCELLLSKLADYEGQPIVQAWFYHQLGCHYQQKTQHGDNEMNENVQNTLKYFQKGIELQPKQKMNYQNIAVQYHETGEQQNYPKALEYYKKSLEIYHNDPFALANLSTLLQVLNEPQQALAAIRICFQNTSFKTVLQVYQHLILTKFQDLEISDVDQVFLDMCKAMENIIPIEAYNNQLFNCFQGILFLALRHKLQCKYTNIIESLISLFREQDILSLKGLSNVLFSRLPKNVDLDREENFVVSLLKYPIQKISYLIIQKELNISRQILSQVVYNKIVMNILSFQSNISHWDLLIEYK